MAIIRKFGCCSRLEFEQNISTFFRSFVNVTRSLCSNVISKFFEVLSEVIRSRMLNFEGYINFRTTRFQILQIASKHISEQILFLGYYLLTKAHFILKSIFYKSIVENSSIFKIFTIVPYILCKLILRWYVLQNIFVYLKHGSKS